MASFALSVLLIVAIFAVETRGRSLEEVSADVLEGADKYIK